jgi:hypothetical protein
MIAVERVKSVMKGTLQIELWTSHRQLREGQIYKSEYIKTV